ncbi:MAG: AtpZ/AtpI family protein [Planctomycetota bacterium]
MNVNLDDRSPTAKAMSKVSEIISICLLMVVPALIGSWVDQKLSTFVLFTIGGLVIGMAGAFLQLKRLVTVPTQKNKTGCIEIQDSELQQPNSGNEPQ